MKLAATLALALALAPAGCGTSHGAAPTRPPAHVKAAALASKSVVETSEYIATIKSRSSVDVMPQVAGHVTAISVKSGDRVRAGTTLLQVDPAKQQAAFLSSEAATGIVRADLERAKATLASLDASRTSKAAALALAEQNHTRSAALFKTNSVSQADLDNATAALDQARADLESVDAQIAAQKAALESARQSLDQARSAAREQQVELQYYRIVAPFEGIVGDIPVRVGDYVSPTTKLTSLDSNSGLEAYISVPVEQASRLQTGLPVKLLDADGKPFAESTVYFVSPAINEDTQSILVKTHLDTAPPGIRTAQFVRAKIVWSTHPGLAIPVNAVARLNGQPFAYVIQEGLPMTVHQTPLTLGEIDGNDVAVTKGLKEGDKVVMSGLQKLADGVPVIVDP